MTNLEQIKHNLKNGMPVDSEELLAEIEQLELHKEDYQSLSKDFVDVCQERDELNSSNQLKLDELQQIAIKNDGLKEYCENVNRKNSHFISQIKRLEIQVKELREKKFWRSEGGDEYWIYMGDETDNLETLTCPVIIGRDDLLDLTNRPTQQNLAEIKDKAIASHNERLVNMLELSVEIHGLKYKAVLSTDILDNIEQLRKRAKE